MKILEAIVPGGKLAITLNELYEGGADVKFILPYTLSGSGPSPGVIDTPRVTSYRVLYAMPEL